MTSDDDSEQTDGTPGRSGGPDHTDDARDRDTGAGYPEEQQGGAQPGAQRGDKPGGDGAPGTSSDQEGDPGQATGNPGAAG